jgi:16S rRNA (adenine1518-N6/adenine1519-N6)-dimethyltransferase
MAQTKTQIHALLAEAGIHPRHRFGQNFMIDANLVRLIADAGQISAGDCVIEIGPGTGTLTEEILSRGGEMIAVEIDRDLAGLLRLKFANEPRFNLIEGDALAGKHALNPDLLGAINKAREAGKTIRLVANLPYNIASPLVIELLLAGVNTLAFTVQKEVAARLVAQAASEDYGPLSIVAQMLAKVEVLRTLSPQVFWPMPTIDSALVRMNREDKLGDRARAFSTFVHALFSSRRKTLRKALLQADVDAEKTLLATGISAQVRPEELSPAQCLALFKAI